MKRNYDDLTPAQKSKWTRESNKLYEQRWNGYGIQYDIWNEKKTALDLEDKPIIDAIKAEAQEKIDKLKQQIFDIQEERGNKISKIYNENREACAEEFKAYEEACDMAHAWWRKEDEKLTERMWTEFGY